jgi:hypothetical protein
MHKLCVPVGLGVLRGGLLPLCCVFANFRSIAYSEPLQTHSGSPGAAPGVCVKEKFW